MELEAQDYKGPEIKPSALKEEDWEDWSLSFTTYLSNIWGKQRAPLDYVVRPDVDPSHVFTTMCKADLYNYPLTRAYFREDNLHVLLESEENAGVKVPGTSLGSSAGRRWTSDQGKMDRAESCKVPDTEHGEIVGQDQSCNQDELSEWFEYVNTYWDMGSSQSSDDDDWKDYSGCDEEEQDSGSKKGSDDRWDAGTTKDQMLSHQEQGHQDRELKDVDEDWIYDWCNQVWQDW